MPLVTMQLLGGFELQPTSQIAGRLVGPKGKALLAIVAACGPGGIGRRRVEGLLWADSSDHDAQVALRQCLYQVRRALGTQAAALCSEGDRLRLDTDCVDVDANRFERLFDSDDPARLAEAAALYRGDFVEGLEAGVEFGAWAIVERERRRDRAQALLERLAAVAPAHGAIHDAALELARRLLRGDPLHEGCHLALIRLYLAAGRRARAEQAWAECKTALRAELGTAPSAEVSSTVARWLAAGAVPAAGGVAGAASPGDEAPTVPCDAFLRGWQLFGLQTAQANGQARAAFEAAARAETEPARAAALVGFTHWFDAITGWVEDPQRSLGEASIWAARALACNSRDQTAMTLLGKLLLWRHEHDAAQEHLLRALAAAPTSDWAHFHAADAATWAGRADDALALLDGARGLERNDNGMLLTIRALAHWTAGRLQASCDDARRAIVRSPDYPWAWATLAAALAETDQAGPGSAHQEAVDAGHRARALNRRFSVSFARCVLPFRNPEHRQRMAHAWHCAGFPVDEALGV